MIDSFTDNSFFGIIITLFMYILGRIVYRKTKLPILNPFLVSLFSLTTLILVLDIPVAHYMKGGRFLVDVLPLTIILLALPLYRQLPLLREHRFAILSGIAAGVITSALSVFILCRLFQLDKTLIKSLLPKSITTPLGLILSDSLGGIISITMISIIITGVMGLLVYWPVFKIFRITHPVAQGIAFGTASHAIGTSKAMELGEVTGAMSGLAIVLTGVATVAATPIFLLIFTFY